MESTLVTRLKSFIETTNLNNSQFADECGIPRPSLSQILTGRNKKISDQFLVILHSKFPDLSIPWLLFGEGEMLKSESASLNGVSDWIEEEESTVPAYVVPWNDDPLVNYGSENRTNPSNLSNAEKKSTENGLTDHRNVVSSRINTGIESDLKIRELQMQIEKMQLQLEKIRENPRKVVSITIYYDDSTFETFIPGSPGRM